MKTLRRQMGFVYGKTLCESFASANGFSLLVNVISVSDKSYDLKGTDANSYAISGDFTYYGKECAVVNVIFPYGGSAYEIICYDGML